MTRLLLLAGTAEARDLAERLAGDRRFDVIASLAGATRDPLPYAVRTRIGGFGGTEGLKAFLVERGIEAVVDATHPFATRMPLATAKAAAALGLPRLRLLRSPWVKQDGDRWIEVADIAEAARKIPTGAVALLTTGSNTVAAFAGAPEATTLVLRAVDPPRESLPNLTVYLKRPPFTLASELALLRELKITHVVTKNAGGSMARPKLDAAREAGLPVIIVHRPAPPEGPVATTVRDALEWLTAS